MGIVHLGEGVAVALLQTLTHSAPGMTTSSGVALAANGKRLYALIINDSDTVVYLNLGGTAAVNTGIRLNAAGGSYEINLANLFVGAINGIHGGTGTKVLLVSEGV